MKPRCFIINILQIIGFVCLLNGTYAARIDAAAAPELLVSEEKSIWHIHKNGFGTKLVSSNYYADIFRAIDYHAEKNLLFWTTLNIPYVHNGSVSTVPLRSTNPEPVKRIIEVGNWDPVAVAVDYVNDKLYVIDWRDSQVNVFDLEGQNRHIILDNLQNPRDIVLDPNEGFMFISDDTGIRRADMDGKSPKNIYSCGRCNVSMTIDPIQKKIYWSTDKENTSRKVVSSDYSGENIADVSEIDVQHKLGIFGNQLYFNGNDQYIRKAEFGSKKFQKMEVYQNISYKHNTVVTLKVIHSSLQKINSQNPCSDNNGQCEQTCLLKPGSDKTLSSSCSCRFGYVLASNAKNCTPVQDYLMYVQGAELRSVILDPEEYTSHLAIQPIDSPYYVFGGFDYDHINGIAYSGDTVDSEVHILKPPSYKFEVFFKEHGKGQIVDVAYDWLTQNLYYIATRKKASEVRVVYTKDKSMRKVLLSNLRDAKRVLVHPHRGFVFIYQRSIELNKLIRINTDGSDFRVIAEWPMKHELQDVSEVEIDFTDDRVYWMDANRTYHFDTKQYSSTVEFHHSDLNGDDPKEFTLDIEGSPEDMAVLKQWLYFNVYQSIWRVDKLTGEKKSKIKDLPSWSKKMIAISIPLLKEKENHPCKVNNGDCHKLCFGVPQSTETQNPSDSKLIKVCSCPEHENLKDGKCEKID